MRKQKFYKLDKILSHDAQYNIIYGERSNGKSYAVKRHVLKEAFETKKNCFVYLRRYREDIKQSYTESYFCDMPIEEITNGEYDSVICYAGVIYFGKQLEDGKVKRSYPIGRACSLSESQRYKSNAFPDVKYVIYEEFLTKSTYLPNEPNMLQDFISTVARRREIKVFCIGNTISRVCPFFSAWKLERIPKQEQGTIDDYYILTDQQDDEGKYLSVKIAVEYAENSGNNSKMFFGEHSKAITSGAWETNPQPHLTKKYSNYEMVYEMLIQANGFQFVLQLLVSPDGGTINFVYPFTGNRNIYRIISNEFSDDPMKTNYFVRDKIRAEKIINDNLLNGKTCYSDNLTGEEFKQICELLELI